MRMSDATDNRHMVPQPQRPPRTYSARRDLIAALLEPYLAVSALVPTNTSPAFEPDLFENSLMCSWADPETLTNRTVSVFVDAVPDGAAKAADTREMIAEETIVTPGERPEDAEAHELPQSHPDEYVFVLNYLGQLTAISGNCVVHLMSRPVRPPLSALADVALEIARKVGCSAYVDDFEPPTHGPVKESGGWTTADGWTYDPNRG